MHREKDEETTTHPMPEQSKKRRQRKRTAAATLLLAYAALAMERADAALLPSVYREIGAALQASPTALGSIALSRSVVQAACYPLAAYLAARHDRLTVIALGAFLWAAATLLIGLSTTFAQAGESCTFPFMVAIRASVLGSRGAQISRMMLYCRWR
jgi:MFS family permease